MILLTAMGSQLNLLLAVCGLILILGLLLKRAHQPYIIAYILTGVAVGPWGFGLVTDTHRVELIGEMGLIILMFFIGMEISLPDFVKKWRVAVFGTGLQVAISVLAMALVGYFLDWEFKRMLLLGFVISLSSSAVVIKLLEDNDLLSTRIGQNVISILITQDILIVPMIIIMSLFDQGGLDYEKISLQVVGGGLMILLLLYLLKNKTIRLPFNDQLKGDQELQVFGGLIICFGMALLSSFFELSAGLGAFVAGLLVHASPATHWLYDSLKSFRIVLVSVFFLSVGMLINIEFIRDNWMIIGSLVLAVYLSNMLINAFLLKMLGNTGKESLFGGALLAQIGEFSFVLISIGYHSSIISLFSYQMTVIVISITIFISPITVFFAKRGLNLDPESLN
ncbi:cation:proton antiporter [Reichenbachiella ulvae]|uniref:Cation:proton antiporter n=1 Tax=Reichenbachiella ulvae TaxID=2980104 RepID=A0ABT3CXH2_9BACT|nr:cation:proton antiporter [Reichenbachiella ulvae]MCV9388276.1 cation:proton antiporter [Reichenbachiella ulvae]